MGRLIVIRAFALDMSNFSTRVSRTLNFPSVNSANRVFSKVNKTQREELTDEPGLSRIVLTKNDHFYFQIP